MDEKQLETSKIIIHDLTEKDIERLEEEKRCPWDLCIVTAHVKSCFDDDVSFV